MSSNSPFEQNSEQYDAWFEKHPFAYRSEVEAIRTLLPNPGKGLEIGVGAALWCSPASGSASSVSGRTCEKRGITVQGCGQRSCY
jgi:hypothetical protein